MIPMAAVSQQAKQSDPAADQQQVAFSDSERKLKAYITALWRMQPVLRAAGGREGKPSPRRVSFDGGYIRVPESFSDVDRHGVEPVFRAAVAHVAAHLVFTGGRMTVGKLKPMQIALVSLVEDARV